MRFFFILLLCITGYNAKAQVLINGTVKSGENEAAEGVNILIYSQNGTDILTYTYTNSQGEFIVELPNKHDSVVLSMCSLSYADTLIRLKNCNQSINIKLPYRVNQIKEVSVKRKSISTKGDTVTYIVSKFAKGKDLSIGDVIANMPGFDVSNEGKIYYQGKPIQKYYIEGMDMLENQYALANKNIPHASVGSVEVLENHQPVRLLQGIVPTDQTSLNIKLKRNIIMTGQACAGAGFKPFLYNMNVTPMFFSPEQQFILSWQVNNTGNDLWNQYKPLALGRISLEGLDNSTPKLVGVSVISKPNIEKERYLFNNSNLLTYTHLVKLSPLSELRVGVNYFYDQIDEKGTASTTYLIADSTFFIKEISRNKYKKSDIGTTVTYFQNSQKRYLKNVLSFDKYNDSETGAIDNTSRTLLDAETPYLSIGNDFEMIIPIQNNFLSVNSAITYEQQPQNLLVEPGVLPGILNGGSNYAQTIQYIKNKSITADNSIKYTKSIKQWMLTTEASVYVENKHLQTHIKTDNQLLLADSLRNNFTWILGEFKITEKVSKKFERGYFDINFPISLVNYSFSDKFHSTPHNINNLILSPSVYFSWKISGFWSSTFSISTNTKLDSPKNIMQGYMLTSYRSIQKQSSNLAERKSITSQVYLQHKNSVTGLFFSLIALRRISDCDVMYKNKLLTSGVIVNEAIEQSNISVSDNISANTSWLISNIYTVLGLKSAYAYYSGKYIFSDIMQKSSSYSYTVSPSIGFSGWKTVGIDYCYLHTIIRQKTNNVNTQYSEQKHKWSIFIYPNAKHLVGADIELYQTNMKNGNFFSNFFVNLTYRFKPLKNQIQVQVKCSNLFNQNHISKFYMSDNIIIFNDYSIRSREFLATITIPITSIRNIKPTERE